jgi:very-short-patch-repair endonuclease
MLEAKSPLGDLGVGWGFRGEDVGLENKLNNHTMTISDQVSMFYGAKPHLFEKAKVLRQNMTEPELHLWQFLKGKKVLGLRFRPQHPIDIFIADFYCHPLKLVIEIDGGYHRETDQNDYDEGRTGELANWGIDVIRFTNKQIEQEFETVKQIIITECEKRIK